MNDDPDSSSLLIELSLLDPAWRLLLPDLPATEDDEAPQVIDPAHSFSGAVTAAFEAAAPESLIGRPIEVSLALCDDAHIRELNRDYRGFDKPTNVLSFGAFDPEIPLVAGQPILLGDVILARETVVREAAQQEKLVSDHVTHLLVHGVLHLLGFDHENDEEADAMEGLEIAVLGKLGIANPYRNGGESTDAAARTIEQRAGVQ